MSTSELQGKIENWLAKTGFPLEMRIAKAFRQVKADRDVWDIDTNVAYVDPKTGSTREVDLLGIITLEHKYGAGQSMDIDIWFLIECKATLTPWIVLKDKFSKTGERPLFNIGTTEKYARGGSVDTRLQLDSRLAKRLPLWPSPGYSVLEAFKDAGTRDAAHSAMQQIANATLYYSNPDNIGARDPIDNELVVCIIPIIITTSPLFDATLSKNGESIITRPVTRSAVRFPINAPRSATVHLITESALSTLIDDLASLQVHIDAIEKEFGA